MMKKILAAFLFCLMFTGGISFGNGYIVRKSRIAGETGIEYARYDDLTTICSVNVVCDGANVVDVDVNGQFILCWSTGLVTGERCETPPLNAPIDTGNHYFTIVGFVPDVTRTYQECDESNNCIDKTYTIPGYQTDPSNEAVLIVESAVTLPPPDKPDGCSIRKFLP